MIQVDNKWKAEEGKFFVRKSDNTVMGDTLYLGEDDSIENYEERPFSEQEREEFEKQYSFGDEGTIASGEASGDDDLGE